MSKFIDITAPKALKMLQENKDAKNVEIEINDGAVCVGGRNSAIDHLQKYKGIIRNDLIKLYFDGIDEVIERNEAARKININKNHANRVTRDVNELIEDTFKFELGIKALFSYVEDADKYCFTVRFDGSKNGAEWGADNMCELLHVQLMPYKDLYSKAVIEPYNYHENV